MGWSLYEFVRCEVACAVAKRQALPKSPFPVNRTWAPLDIWWLSFQCGLKEDNGSQSYSLCTVFTNAFSHAAEDVPYIFTAEDHHHEQHCRDKLDDRWPGLCDRYGHLSFPTSSLQHLTQSLPDITADRIACRSIACLAEVNTDNIDDCRALILRRQPRSASMAREQQRALPQGGKYSSGYQSYTERLLLCVPRVLRCCVFVSCSCWLFPHLATTPDGACQAYLAAD